MQYIVHTDFIGKAICGEVNFPAGTECTENNGTIYHDDQAVCRVSSNNAYKYFARNNDGNGLKRGELIKTIKGTLALEDEHHYERWYRVFNDPVCQQFDRDPNGDTWEWNLAFYNASIAALQHIADLVTDENWLGIEEEAEDIPDPTWEELEQAYNEGVNSIDE